MSGEKILIVDDETEIVELITLYLRKEGFDVLSSSNGAEAIEMVRLYRPDLVILDILLPELDGIEVCRQIRKHYTTPILFLSCKSEDMDIILGFSIGGDDYMTKPFSPGQLVARVKAHLRRSQLLEQHKEEAQILSYPGLEIDLLSRTVKVRGRPVPLSSKEFDLLLHLARTPGQVMSLEQLYKLTWGVDSNGDTRTLLVHISNLRKKVEPNPADPRYILTVRGTGYKFNG
ncbi:DNA-binding response regulator, OmpR family, contains REC and winged-helix (wHTH) domain [Paenibacillus sp. UNCCL117]|uniref:response regulator transcription factor n=1 Tax=unclassified Paenibacillus TaxID=185978 RepID=UPI00088067E8|nr:MULTISPECIES: response regulator transcription factor [unclassified Paenibacillus]SDD15870.1 DNA-binding response regulator, OmpR family, contains REC and winged-helix (wHTH) domain [Paenibacillus sp. cl123]SFW34557.1 DNA-binding response regulator, OmpR family, contains REC and winged-helix (wHTH) domain [Paenibacillus sp. UNCCL117]